jgi:hypothetical protein
MTKERMEKPVTPNYFMNKQFNPLQREPFTEESKMEA